MMANGCEQCGPAPLPRSIATGAPPAIAVSGAAAEMTKNATPQVPNVAWLVFLSCRFAHRDCNVVGAHGVLRLLCGAFRIVAGPLGWVLGRRWARAVCGGGWWAKARFCPMGARLFGRR
jgi:hypothetical protein